MGFLSEISNDPNQYDKNTPFLIYDEDDETIIYRTANEINEGVLNAFKVNWMEVTLYLAGFIRDFLERIDSFLIMDVAQAMDDEVSRHSKEDGRYTNVCSHYYGTGKGNATQYSYLIDNWRNDNDMVLAVDIAEEILVKRNKVEAYNKKVKLHKRKTDVSKEGGTSSALLDLNSETEQLQQQIDVLKAEINRLAKEKASVEQQLEQQTPETAFNGQTGKTCFTSKQMCIFLRAIAELTEQPNPPAKSTLGEVVEKIGGYAKSAATNNLKQSPNANDKEIVASAIEIKFPNLADKVRRL